MEDIGGNHLSGEPEDMKSFYSEDRALYKAFSKKNESIYAKSTKSKHLGVNDLVYADNVDLAISDNVYSRCSNTNKSPNVPIDQMNKICTLRTLMQNKTSLSIDKIFIKY